MGDFHTYATYSDVPPTLTLEDIRRAANTSLPDRAKRQMQRDMARLNDRLVAAMWPAAVPDPSVEFRFPIPDWGVPGLRSTFETFARRTSEFRKLRLEPDTFLGVGAQVVEDKSVPETDSDGKEVGWSAGGTVLLASVAVVTKLRFDAWMQRLGGDDDA